MKRFLLTGIILFIVLCFLPQQAKSFTAEEESLLVHAAHILIDTTFNVNQDTFPEWTVPFVTPMAKALNGRSGKCKFYSGSDCIADSMRCWDLTGDTLLIRQIYEYDGNNCVDTFWTHPQ